MCYLPDDLFSSVSIYFILFTVLETLWQVALFVSLRNDNIESVCYLCYVYSQGSSSRLSVKLLSKFRTPQSKSSTDAWPRAAWQTYSHTKLTRYGYVKLERPEQCLWWIIQRACVKLFTLSVALERQKNFQNHSDTSSQKQNKLDLFIAAVCVS